MSPLPDLGNNRVKERWSVGSAGVYTVCPYICTQTCVCCDCASSKADQQNSKAPKCDMVLC